MKTLYKLFFITSLLVVNSAFAQTTRYVNTYSGEDTGNCSDSGNPCNTIFYAYEMSDSGDVIEVSEGTYTEFFEINKSISIHGSGSDMTIIQAHESPEMSNNQVFNISFGNEVSISGLTIRYGNGLSGGGIYNLASVLTLSNVNFEDNYAYTYGGALQNFDATVYLYNVQFVNNHAGGGGGMRNDNSEVYLNDVYFFENKAEVSGGGMYNVNSSGIFKNIIFSGNEATNSGGGMVNFDNSSPVIINALFSGNKSGTSGGAMANVLQSSPSLTNVTFSGNNAGGMGGAVFNLDESSPELTNVIIWLNSSEEGTLSPSSSISNLEFSNPTISYSLIANSGGSNSWNEDIGIDAGNNVAENPMFIEGVNPGDAPSISGNLRLNENSPAVDSGNPSIDLALFPEGPDNPLDLDNNPRVYNSIIDMGAYENQGSLPLSYVITTESSPAEGGDTSGGGTFEFGQMCTLLVAPNEGYTFESWTENGEIVSTSSFYSFTVTENRHLTANFTASGGSYVITTESSPAEGGDTSGGGTFEFGQICTLLVAPNEGYAFENWTENGEIVSTSSFYSFTVTENRHLTANFTTSGGSYVITTQSNPLEGGNAIGGGIFEEGQICILIATPNEGYVFESWTENGAIVSINPVYNFTVTGNRDMTANFQTDLSVGNSEIGSQVTLYPNPVTSVLNIIANESVKSVTVFNLLGQQVMSSSHFDTALQLDMSRLEANIYFVEVATEQAREMYKIIKK